jgi:hypothetical protein
LYYPNKIMVRWSAISGATGYDMERSNQSSSSGWGPVFTNRNLTAFDDTTVTPYIDYWYRVRAVKGTVKGQWSEPAYGNASGYSDY